MFFRNANAACLNANFTPNPVFMRQTDTPTRFSVSELSYKGLFALVFPSVSEGGDRNGSAIGSTIALTFAVQSQLYCSTIGTLLYQHWQYNWQSYLHRNGSTMEVQLAVQ